MTQTVSTSYLSTHQMPAFLNPLQMAYFSGESRAERKVINLKSEMLIVTGFGKLLTGLSSRLHS